MDFFTAVNSRRSVRAFKSNDVEEVKLQKVLESTNSAPSAGNLQAYEIVLVSEAKQKEELAEASHDQQFIAEAPVVLVFCANPKRSYTRYSQRGANLYCLQDATIAASYAQLAATALGLASVWVGAFDENAVSKIISAKDVKPVAIIPIGYPNEEPEKTTRRRLEDIVHKEQL